MMTNIIKHHALRMVKSKRPTAAAAPTATKRFLQLIGCQDRRPAAHYHAAVNHFCSAPAALGEKNDLENSETTHISPNVAFGPFGSGGTVVGYSKYDGVRGAFEENFASRLELGSQLVVYQDGEKVVDLYGRAPEQPGYDGDTLQCVYSSGKNMEAAAMAVLVDRGHMCYDDPVTRHWPEFGANGKAGITVADVMRHEGGVPFLVDPESPGERMVVDPDDVSNVDRLEAKICAARKHPFYGDGGRNGRMYHTITRGWVVNGILRRADPAHRTLGVFIKEEMSDRLGLTYFCGIPEKEQGKYKFASMTKSSLPYDLLFQIGPAAFGRGEPELWRTAKAFAKNEDSLMRNQVASWIGKLPSPAFNDTMQGRSLEISSGGMFANARSVAKINAVLAGDGSFGGIRLLDANTLDESMGGIQSATDLSLSLDGINWSYGMTRGGFGSFHTFFGETAYGKDFFHPDDKTAFGSMMGWGGWGGSLSLWDRNKNIAFAYVPNAMSLNLIGGPRSRRILLELQKCI